ncbi:GH36-type glycosyl hydrolase domain-containing protein [Bacillus sp. NTK034]|uniref:GH36-type glycosyl hydrolase domain-containing protein n=1 Tax=Bacillus sp. NTK034 TaxID=2802176 RepID=UPI001A8E26DD|nr:amylo-alpha-1,6-glucosidase [Bacillus sp. NTK034]MBN8199777.1 cellobiose phosphorylase [Bacillus sp. NTK034]
MTRSKFTIQANDLSFTFLNSGDIFEIAHHSTMINQWLSNPIDGSLNNLFLRVHDDTGIRAFPLLGVKSQSRMRTADNQVVWEGEAGGISYQVTFTLTEKATWFWNIELHGDGYLADVIYGQDLGLADKGAVRTNEAYMSQYIDHKVYNGTKNGYAVCSRQNQPTSGGRFPYIQQGSLTKSIGYSTDGFQFFGLSYKETDIPEALDRVSLANEIYQYEFAYTALQSEKIELTGKAQVIFYGIFKENHQEAITDLEFENEILEAWEKVPNAAEIQVKKLESVRFSPAFGKPLETVSMTKAEINVLFPRRHQEEISGDTLLSFFTEQHEHVVLKEKELLVERPHGHIIMTGENVENIKNVLTSTLYMYGIFNSHIVMGNTSFNKMLTNARNALNIMKTSGQRIYVEVDGQYRLLTMPSMFEMGFNYGRWYYKTADDLLVITSYTCADASQLELQVRSDKGKAYRYLVTNQVSMNNNEYAQPFKIEHEGNELIFKAGENSDSSRVFPDLTYLMQINGADFKLKDSSFFGENLEDDAASLAVLEMDTTSEWSMAIQGLLDGKELAIKQTNLETEKKKYHGFLASTMNGFRLAKNGAATEELNKINALAWWYTHNMLVHYSAPHGLEQYGGAAWGTRDVCQGPTEYFIATQKYDSVKNIILTVYSHQYADDGNWPQWFMFDDYFRFQQEESHGDIIVWPLKVIAEYLKATNDFSILNESLPFTEKGSFEFTKEKASLLDHVKKQIQYMKDHFLHDTYLSSYGDGDWDDTLQPANAQLKQYMASSWTVALTYQVIGQFSLLLKHCDKKLSLELNEMAEGIKKDFNTYMLSSETIPGFVYMENPEKPELMLHPSDTKTGIQYRLLPMTRSMIGELLTPEQAEEHYKIIRQKLYHPDGVRLMDRPASYRGGVSANFKRAEQAANFGREIGLQYVHAHIRFVEAMAKLGKSDEVWTGLQKINPIGIQKVVPNAELRQSNSYFSSSDGKFNTRYEAAEDFDKLRDGSAPVKGGWRIYSSGPGIYMNQLISNALGIRRDGQNLIIDPVLPEENDGMDFQFRIDGKEVTFIYHLGNHGKAGVMINGSKADAEQISNLYRTGGYRISSPELKKHLKENNNSIEIYL